MTEDELKAFCKDQITHFKIPRHVRFVTEYPMTVTGKIQKFVMLDQMVEALAGKAGCIFSVRGPAAHSTTARQSSQPCETLASLAGPPAVTEANVVRRLKLMCPMCCLLALDHQCSCFSVYLGSRLNAGKFLAHSHITISGQLMLQTLGVMTSSTESGQLMLHNLFSLC